MALLIDPPYERFCLLSRTRVDMATAAYPTRMDGLLRELRALAGRVRDPSELILAHRSANWLGDDYIPDSCMSRDDVCKPSVRRQERTGFAVVNVRVTKPW